jgi:hypothetical protein
LGVDLDPDRVAEATNAAQIAQVQTRALFRRQDLFETPLREASVVTLYLLPRINCAAAASADRIAARRPHRQPQFHDGRLAARTRRARSAPRTSISGWCLLRPRGLGLCFGRRHAARLELEQRFQDVSGSSTACRCASQPARPHLRFTVDLRGGARTFHALVEGLAPSCPTPRHPQGSPGGWRAFRAY